MRRRPIVFGLGILVLGWFLVDAAARAYADRRARDLIRIAAEDDPRAKAEALQSLRDMGPSAGTAAAGALKDGEPRERGASLLACEQVVEACLDNFSTMNCMTGYVPGRGVADRAYEEVGAALAAALANGDAKVRREAARIILRGPDFPADRRQRAASVLREAMGGPDPAARRSLVETMCRSHNGSSPRDADEVVPILIEALKDPDASVRRSAVEALGRSYSLGAAPPLVEALKDPEQSVRRAAERACFQEDYSPSFTPASFDRHIREIRAAFRSDLPFFIDWLKHGDPEAATDRRDRTRHRAVVALHAVGGREVIAPLADALKASLKDGNADRRRMIAAALEDLAKDADCFAALCDHVPELTEALTGHSESDVRSSIVSILRRSGSATDAAVAILIARLGDPKPFTREDAVYGLGWLGTSADKVHVTLRRVEAEDTDPRVRKAVREVLAR